MAYSLTLKDYDGEKSSFGFKTAQLNATSIDAQITAQATFELALAAMVRGDTIRSSLGNVIEANSNVTDEWAQRELKWRVDYHDLVTGDPGHITIGTANTLRLNPNAKGKAFMGDGAEVDDFVAAFEMFARSQDGNTVKVDQILMVGRNI